MKRSVWNRRVPRAVTFSVAAAVAASAVAVGYFAFRQPELTGDGSYNPAGRPALPPGSYARAPLPPGTPSPTLEAAGWVNGSPPKPGEEGPRLIILDIWSHW
jgi:hypothetical protein